MIQEKILSNAIKILDVEESPTIQKTGSDFLIKTEAGQVINCFIPAATHIGRLSGKDGFSGKSKEEEASVYQWLEFALLHADCREKEMLLDLNHYLQDKVYLVSNRFTIADLLLYLCLHELFTKLSFQDKESICNVSRWFRLIQHNANACDLYPKICFSKFKLY